MERFKEAVSVIEVIKTAIGDVPILGKWQP